MTDRAGNPPALRRFTAIGIATAAVMLVVYSSAWSVSFSRTLDQLETEAQAELAFTAEALEKDLTRYKLLAKALSQTGTIRRRAVSDTPFYDDEATNLLLRMEAISGSAKIHFLTHATAPDGPVGKAVNEAYQGIMGFAFDPERGGSFIIAAPVWSAAKVAGTVSIRISAGDLEWSWRPLPQVVFFTGSDNRIQLSSLLQLRLRALSSADAPLPDRQTRLMGERVFWNIEKTGWNKAGISFDRALVLRRPTPVLDMTAFTLVDTGPARRTAQLASIASAAIVLILGMTLAAIVQWRASLNARHVREARATAELELRVADRTHELTAEIAERRATEQRLRATQDELVQAGKLSALGQMAAGIAHEINQPLAAIRGFAENATVFLDRDRPKDARKNLDEIASLTSRAARIIRNLRAFARNQTDDVTAINLSDVVNDAVEIIAVRAKAEAATINWHAPDTPLMAMAGAVRLQQVMINLMANALDAQPDKPVIEIAPKEDAAHIWLTVRDQGPGLTDEVSGKLFDPFFSTKSASGEGLGLGLSISYGIVQSFGGMLSAENHPDGGAVFTIKLRRAGAKAKAA